MNSETPEFLYRYVEDSLESLTIRELEFKVVKRTPQGVWILASWPDGKKWVSLSGRKRFAYPDKKEALNSFRIRKVWQKRRCEMSLGIANELLDMIEKGEVFRSDEDCACELYREG